ncbi:MAG: hypothetical protein A2Y17_09485 [Clostridiales bacterium GWF2_38_85]|nr:MAG: hypothetical protein A2Y17_09485 [Clostridiales bacterium GWF2_38_85]HBL83570.1 hypothetical protein [Clostridiales bacterium]
MEQHSSKLKTTEFTTITILLILKLIYFYIYIGIGFHSATLLLESFVLLTVAWSIYVLMAKRMPFRFTFILYIIISIIMLVDLTYFNYFGKLPSVFMLTNTGLVGDVGASVIKLLSFSSLVAIIDLPLIIIYFIFFRKKFIDKQVVIFPFFKKLTVILLITSSLLLTGDILITRFMLKDLQNEFLIFHTVDIGRYIFGVHESEETYQNSIKTDYTDSTLHGIAEGKNLIVIQVESLQGFVAGKEYNGKEITPNINKLMNDGAYFQNYYYQTGGGNTSDAEFTVNNSLFAPEYESAYIKYAENTFYGLPWILKENGFKTAVTFHAFKGEFWNREEAYVNQGFNDFISREDTDVLSYGDNIGLGMNDKDFMLQSLEHIKTLHQPFYSFLITLTSHHPYIMPFENRFDILEKDEGTIFADYLSSINYVDECIGSFIDGLKECGLYDDCVIVLYGDHFAIPLNDSESAQALERFLGYEYSYDEFLRVPCVIAVPGSDEQIKTVLNKTYTVTGGHADLMPTILDLFGYKSDSMIMFGQNLFSATEGHVYPQASLQRGSFVTDDIIFIFPQSEMLMNSIAYKKSDRSEIEPECCEDVYESALAAYNDSDYILDNNIIDDILKYGRENTLSKISDTKNSSNSLPIESEQNNSNQVSDESEEVTVMINDVTYRTTIYSVNKMTGQHNNTEVRNNVLTLTSKKMTGSFISNPIYVGQFDMLITSWSAKTFGGSVEISVAYELKDGTYSDYYSYGVWSSMPKASYSSISSDANGDMQIDTLYAKQNTGSHIKLKITLSSEGATENPILNYIAITGNTEPKKLISDLPEQVLIDVPQRSQMIIPEIGNKICSPTSLSMVLEYLGSDFETIKVANGVYDSGAKIYGNWVFNTAFATEQGYDAYIDNFDMQALKYALSKGVPVICSIATSDKTQLEGSPMAYPGGHLLVVCGYKTVDGIDYLIVNDPAASENNSVRRMYRVDQFERIWNGIVYIIQ